MDRNVLHVPEDGENTARIWIIDAVVEQVDKRPAVRIWGHGPQGHTVYLCMHGWFPSCTVRLPGKKSPKAEAAELKVYLEQQLRQRKDGANTFYDEYTTDPPMTENTSLDQEEMTNEVLTETEIQNAPDVQEESDSDSDSDSNSSSSNNDDDDDRNRTENDRLYSIFRRSLTISNKKHRTKRTRDSKPIVNTETEEEQTEKRITRGKRWYNYCNALRQIRHDSLIMSVTLLQGSSFYGFTDKDAWFAQFNLCHSQLRRPAAWAFWEYPGETLEVFEAMHDLTTTATAELNIGFSQWNVLHFDELKEYDVKMDTSITPSQNLEAQIEMTTEIEPPAMVKTSESRLPLFFQPIPFQHQPPPPLEHFVRLSIDFEMCAFPLFDSDPSDFNHKRMTYAANGNPVIAASVVVSRYNHPHEVHLGWWGVPLEDGAKVDPVESIEPVLHYFSSELDLLLWVIYMIHTTDADYITGWNTLGFDMPYLFSRLHLGAWRTCVPSERNMLQQLLPKANRLVSACYPMLKPTHNLQENERAWIKHILQHQKADKPIWTVDVAMHEMELGRMSAQQAALALVWWDMSQHTLRETELQQHGIWIQTNAYGMRTKLVLRPTRISYYWTPVWLADDLLTERRNQLGKPPIHPKSSAAARFVSEDEREKSVRVPRWAICPKNNLGRFCICTLQDALRIPINNTNYLVFRAEPASRFVQLGRQNPWTQPTHILRAQPSRDEDMPPRLESVWFTRKTPTGTKEQVTVTAQRQFRRENILTNGRFYSDEMLAVQNRMPQLPSFSLDYVSSMNGLGKYPMGYDRIPGCWSTAEGTRELLFYVGSDGIIPVLIQEKQTGLIREFKVSQISNTPIKTVVARGASLRGTSLIKNTLEWNVLHESGELARRRFLPSYRPRTFEGQREPFVEQYQPKNTKLMGAFCLPTNKGCQKEPVVVFDFASLYPNTIRELGLCHSTIVPHGINPADIGLVPSDIYTVPEISVDPITKEPTAYIGPTSPRFMVPSINSKRYTGVLPNLLQEKLLNLRKKIKKEVAVHMSHGRTEEAMLGTASEQAIKLMANSIYGFVGASTSPLLCFPVAASTTGGGRYRLVIIRYFTEHKYTTANGYPFTLRVVAGDTDSVMARFDGICNRYARPTDVRQRLEQSKQNAKQKKEMKRNGTLDEKAEEDMLRLELIPASNEFYSTVWHWSEIIEDDMNHLLRRIRPCNILQTIDTSDLTTTDEVANAVYAEEKRILMEEIATRHVSDELKEAMQHFVTTQAMEAEKIFDHFTSIAKKRYFALKVTPFYNPKKELIGFQFKPDMMGLDAKRRNTIVFIRDTQRELIQRAVIDGDHEQVFAYAQRRFRQLEARLVPLHELASSCSLSHPLHQYKTIVPAVAIARRQKGSVAVGTRFEYLVAAGRGKINERAYTLYEMMFDKTGLQIDCDYYLRRWRLAIQPVMAALIARDRETLSFNPKQWTDTATMEITGESSKKLARADRAKVRFMDHSKRVDTNYLDSIFQRTAAASNNTSLVKSQKTQTSVFAAFQPKPKCKTIRCPNVVQRNQTFCSECQSDPQRQATTIVSGRLHYTAYKVWLDSLHRECETCVEGSSDHHQELIRDCTLYSCPVYCKKHFCRDQQQYWDDQLVCTTSEKEALMERIQRGFPRRHLQAFTETPGYDWTKKVPESAVESLRRLALNGESMDW